MAKTNLDLTQDKDKHIDQQLRTAPIIWLGSVRPDGRPHLVPVWFLWDGATILIFSIPNNQKLRNIMQNPNVVLAVDDSKGGNDPIVIEGQAELLTEGSVDTTQPAYVEKYATLLTEMGWSASSMASNYSQAIRVTPTRFMGVS